MGSIEGNIGAGKSTVLNKLKCPVFKERIDEWPLDIFYNDQSRWALTLQIRIIQTSIKPPPNGVAERNPMSALNVFWRHMVDNKIVTQLEDDVCRWIYDKFSWEPEFVVYLKASPEKCFSNISKRVQAGDSNVTLDYLKDIDRLYDEYIKSLPADKVYIVDANEDEDTVYNNVRHILECRRNNT